MLYNVQKAAHHSSKEQLPIEGRVKSGYLAVSCNMMLKRGISAWKHFSSSTYMGTGSSMVSTVQPVCEKKLEGKVAVITGAGSGIGECTARLFTAHGAHVIVADIADEEGTRVVRELGSAAHYLHCDVTRESDVSAAVDYAMDTFGHLDVMFNNAGIVTPNHSFQELPIDYYDYASSIMVRGVILGIKHAARVMVPARTGCIVSTASTSAVIAGHAFPLTYALSKMALPGITKVAACDLGRHGIRVNLVSPHAVATPLLAKHVANVLHLKDFNFEVAVESFKAVSDLAGVTCTASDVANGVVYLSSSDARYINGHNLIIDGGFSNIRHFDPFRLF